jgi:hypothetical protein
VYIKPNRECIENYKTDESVKTVVEINSNYFTCKQKLVQNWRISKHRSNQSLDLIEQQLCCARWDYSDCLLDTAKEVCTEQEYKHLKAKAIKWNTTFKNNNCTEYVYHSCSCHLFVVKFINCLICLSCALYFLLFNSPLL